MTRTSLALVALVGLLVVAPVIGAAQSSATPTPANNTTATANDTSTVDEGLTLEGLQQNGPRQANSPDGVRMGEERSYWAVYWPADNPFAEPGDTEGGEYLPPGHTVGRNSIWLRTWTYDDRQRTVHVAYWERGSRTVREGNTTTEVPVARNVTHVTHEVTFGRGRPTVEIPLRQHDDRVQVTMWIEGEDFARWTFAHQSIATTQAADIDSQGDYLSSVITDFLLWILVGGFVVGWLVKQALDRAGIGPQYGYAPWLVGLSLLTGLGSLLLYESVASLLVNAQYVLALYVVGIIGIVMLETYTTNVSTALFLRPTLGHSESPTGDDAFDMLDGECREEKIVRTPDGSVTVVKGGLLPFLARAFGASAELENVEQLRTRVPMDGKYDELFLVDPEADEILYYSPESWRTNLPEFSRANAAEYAILGGGVALAGIALATGTVSGTNPTLALVGLVGAGLGTYALEPVDGVAVVNPAPVHLRTAFGTLVNYAEDVDDAKHFDEVKQQLDGERISKQREVDREVADHDRTLVEGMLDPEDKIPAAVEDGDDPDEIAEETDPDGPLGTEEVPSDD